MGRLFWKFFFFIWLAQLSAVFGISGVFWLKDRNQREQFTALDATHPAAMQIETASLVLTYGGKDALRALLEQPTRHPVFAVDVQGRELLDRPVSQELLSKAHAAASENPTIARTAGHPKQQSLLLFMPRSTELSAAPGMSPPLPPDAVRPPPPDGRFFVPEIPLIIALLASLIFAILLAWYVSKPIHTLRTAFDKAAHGELTVRIANQMGGRRDELADLGRDFDHMADQLQAVMEGQRRLLHDVSHEMRSPLARLQVAIGLARQQPEKFEATMVRIERESERMDTLVGELLTLSRLEGHNGQPEFEPVSPQLLLDDVVEDARFEAEANQRQITLAQCPDCTLAAQPELLQRALENIVRNAIRHTPAGTAVHIEAELAMNAKHLTIRILDQGPGVDEHELETIFVPFYRSEKSTGNGYGLGLAIAKRIVDAHGGNIHAYNRDQAGLGVDIVLPVAS